MLALLVDGLAAFRLTRLARTDGITAPARDWIVERSVEVIPGVHECNPKCGPDGHVAWMEPRIKNVQPFAFVRELLDCPNCTAVWCAGLTLLFPRQLRYLLAVAAVAGAAADWYDRTDEKRLG